MDMGKAYIKGVTEQLPQAQISFDRFHVVAMANEAMNEVRKAEMRGDSRAVREALDAGTKKDIKPLFWAVQKAPAKWNKKQMNIMHLLQRSRLKTARAWRSKEAVRDAYRTALEINSSEKTQSMMNDLFSWAR